MSPHNPLLKEIRRAAVHGTLTDRGYALAEGFHLFEEAMASGAEIAAVVGTGAALDTIRAGPRPQSAGLPYVTVEDAVFKTLRTTEHSQGILTLVKPHAWTLENCFEGRALALILDGIQDPGNAGALIRSAEAFGATGVVFLKGSVNPYNPKCMRGSAGSIFRLPVVSGLEPPALFEALDRREARLYAAAPRASLALDRADFSRSCAIVVGGEGKGIGEAVVARAESVRIPTRRVESLNAAVAGALFLYEARRQRGSA